MQKINFVKMVASGNDFIVTEIKNQKVPACRQAGKSKNLNILARKVCDRKYGIGADGLLLLERSPVADIKMRIFNPDGSEPVMCGNGARCVALYIGKRNGRIETHSGIIESQVNDGNVKIKLTDPKNIKLNIPLKINNRQLKANFINTGVPHTVIFVQGLEKIDVVNLGRGIRNHSRFKPAGTNVDFVEVSNSSSIKVRTYERGVEGETLACGTGAVASALITIYHLPFTIYHMIQVHTKSGEILKVYFDRMEDKFKNVWLEGKAKIVYKGVYHV